MFRSIIATAATVVAASTLAASGPLSAQVDVPVPPDQQVRRPAQLKLAGPRFGFTAFTGDVAEQRDLADLEPFMSQFGWQWETRVVATDSGHQALLEWVALVGGVEQGELNMSLSFLAGLRLENGVEFGVGPNISFNPDHDEPTRSMIVASGATIPVGDLFLPVNVAMGLARGGPRMTVLLGWVVGR